MKRTNIYWLSLIPLLFFVGGIYIANQVYTIYGGDAGDLVSAIVTHGVPHPPGYPLYTFLGVIANEIIHGGTAAWRVGSLSSISAILTLLVLFDLLYYLTRRLAISLISVLVLAFSYPFWLYSEVVEVFSLNNLFLVLLLWSFIKFAKEEKKKFFYLGAYLFGLSLSHHHIILFLIPSLLYLLWKKRILLRKNDLAAGLFLLVLGLLPYIYVVASAAGNPAINWVGLPNISSFIALVTRSTYGTFRAGQFIGQDPYLRLLDVWGFIIFALKDFRISGLILFFLGFIYLIHKERTLFIVFFAGLLSYIFFLFYASFPLGGNFIVGTFERFILPLYIFITIFISFGLLFFVNLIERFFVLLTNKTKTKTLISFVIFIFLIYPLGLLFINYPKISILKTDFTAENFGLDILSSVPQKSIILIATDTSLFDSQYVYFTQKKWPSIELVHFSKLLNPINSAYFKKFSPDMVLPDYKQSPSGQLQSFISANYKKFAIFSKQAYVSDNGIWVPWGLLFRYYQKDDIPADKVILAENEKLWSGYHDPLSGSLSKFKSLLLSDTLGLYSTARQEIGFWAAKRGFNDVAESHLLTSEKLTPDDLDSYNILSQVYIAQNKCDLAKQQIDYRISKNKEDPNNYLLFSIDYAVCYRDQKKADYFQKLYEEKNSNKQTPLRKL